MRLLTHAFILSATAVVLALLYIAPMSFSPRSALPVFALIAALAPSAGVATGIAIPLFFVIMLLGGVYLPRYLLPDALVTIGRFTPPGVDGLQAAWLGAAPELLPLGVLAGITLVATGIAGRVFRWE